MLLGLHPVGHFLGWPILYALHTLVNLQGKHGIKQTDDEVLVVAEYLPEGQVGSRLSILSHSRLLPTENDGAKIRKGVNHPMLILKSGTAK